MQTLGPARPGPPLPSPPPPTLPFAKPPAPTPLRQIIERVRKEYTSNADFNPTNAAKASRWGVLGFIVWGWPTATSWWHTRAVRFGFWVLGFTVWGWPTATITPGQCVAASS